MPTTRIALSRSIQFPSASERAKARSQLDSSRRSARSNKVPGLCIPSAIRRTELFTKSPSIKRGPRKTGSFALGIRKALLGQRIRPPRCSQTDSNSTATHARFLARAAPRRAGKRKQDDIEPRLFETASDTLETVACLLKEPLHHAGHVIAVSDVVAEGREAMGLTSLLHCGKLLEIEFVVFDRAPIVVGVVHREARRKSAVGADDEPVLAGAASPMFSDTAHEAFHVLQARDGIDHLVALALLVD